MGNSIFIIGGLAAFLFLYVAYILLFRRIMFDRMLIHGGSFMLKIAFMVILTPFLLTFLMTIHNFFVRDEYKVRPSENFIYATDNADGSQPQAIAKQPQDSQNLFWSVYYNFIDPGSEYIIATKGGKVWAIIVAVFGTFLLNGLLVSTMVGYIDSRKDNWLNGKMRYSKSQFLFKKTAVVIGANEMAPTIIRNLLCGQGEGRVHYVVLLTNEDVEKVRCVIESYLTKEEEARLIIYNGQLDSKEEISRLHLEDATEICILGEDSHEDTSESYHDVQNMRCVHNIASYLADMRVDRKIVCRVMFEFQTTYSVFQFSDLHENIRRHLNFIPFNAYENWAQRVFVKGYYEENETCSNDKNSNDVRVFNYLPLDGKDGISPESDKYVHLVVAGMSNMGVAIAIQAAQVAHYPNFKIKDADGQVVEHPLRTRITFIDTEADKEMLFFKGRFRNLFDLSRWRYIDATTAECNLNVKWNDSVQEKGSEYSDHGINFLDVEWEFVKGSLEQPMVAEYLKTCAKEANPSHEGNALLTIAVCHQKAHEAIAASIYMPAEVYDHAQQILVYQREASDIVYNLISDKTNAHKRYAKLRPFGMQYADFTFDPDSDLCAKLCNYIYTIIGDAALHERITQIGRPGSEDSFAKVVEKWEELPVFHKWSNKYLVNSFTTKIRSVCGCIDESQLDYEMLFKAFEEHKDDMAECEHNRWNMQQLLMGFRAYNNEELKEFDKIFKATSPNRDAVVKEYKNAKKNSSERVHLNICSLEQLLRVDAGTKCYDEYFNTAIPAILKRVELHARIMAEKPQKEVTKTEA